MLPGNKKKAQKNQITISGATQNDIINMYVVYQNQFKWNGSILGGTIKWQLKLRNEVPFGIFVTIILKLSLQFEKKLMYDNGKVSVRKKYVDSGGRRESMSLKLMIE